MARHWLKIIALALIVFPEPVTTAIGIALLSLIAAFSARQRLSKFEDLEGLVKRSIKDARPSEIGLGLFKERTSVFHALKTNAEPQCFSISCESTEIHKASFAKLILADPPIPNVDTRRFNKITFPVLHVKVASDDAQTTDVDARRFHKITCASTRTKHRTGDQPIPGVDTRRFLKIGGICPGSPSLSWFDNRKIPETILHHTLRTSLPQYQASLSRVTA